MVTPIFSGKGTSKNGVADRAVRVSLVLERVRQRRSRQKVPQLLMQTFPGDSFKTGYFAVLSTTRHIWPQRSTSHLFQILLSFPSTVLAISPVLPGVLVETRI